MFRNSKNNSFKTYRDPYQHRLLLLHVSSVQNISSKFIDNFLSYPADRQTGKGKNITSAAEVTTCRQQRMKYGNANCCKMCKRRTAKKFPEANCTDRCSIASPSGRVNLYLPAAADKHPLHWNAIDVKCSSLTRSFVITLRPMKEGCSSLAAFNTGKRG